MQEKEKNEKITNENEDSNDSKDDTQEDCDPTRYGDWEKEGRCIDF